MTIIKIMALGFIILLSNYIGILYAKNFSNRVKDLEEMKHALKLFETKIKFTYEPIPEVFESIAKETKANTANIFLEAVKLMKNEVASNAWKKALYSMRSKTNFTDEDIVAIGNLSKMLGNTDLEGQINMIKLTEELIDEQIKIARKEEIKNAKLYKTLGMGIGISIAIILL